MWRCLFLISLCFGFYTSILAQQETSPCFDVQEIRTFRYEPSKKGQLPQKQTQKEIVFELVQHRQSSKVLTARMFDRQGIAKDSIQAVHRQKAAYAAHKYRIAYLANYRDSSIHLSTTFGRISLIQEAKDSLGRWRPIEYLNDYVFCGVGAFGQIDLAPLEFVEIYIPKYCGSFYTQLRMTLVIAGEVIHSEVYEGFIHPEQMEAAHLKQDPDWRHFNFVDRSLSEELERLEKQ